MNNAGMERQDIEIFLALGQELHFARTAQRLRVAPASIRLRHGIHPVTGPAAQAV
jgi:hypothetical protein